MTLTRTLGPRLEARLTNEQWEGICRAQGLAARLNDGKTPTVSAVVRAAIDEGLPRVERWMADEVAQATKEGKDD